MPLILKKKTDRAAVQIAHAAVLRTSDEVIRQLQDQLDAERAQHAFNCAEYEADRAAAA